jgi:predicted RNase H-like HicB family nuclease
MTNLAPTIFISKQSDDTFLAVSIDLPRFCISGRTEADAEAKAQRAIDFYNRNKHRVLDLRLRETRVITPAFEEKELCIA